MKMSYGAVPKARLKRVLEALLNYAVEEKNGPLHLKYRQLVHLRRGKQPNELYVRTSTAALQDLINQFEVFQDKDADQPFLRWQISEALKHLEITLGILVDCRRKTQGATDRSFRLHFWHPIIEIHLNLSEVNHRWPKSQPLAMKPSLDSGQNHIGENKQLLQLMQFAVKPITPQQFARAIGLLADNEKQSKTLLAETCIFLLQNLLDSCRQYLYRFSAFHLLEAELGEQLLSLICKTPQLQRATVDTVVDQFVQIQAWPSGGTNGFLLQLANSEEWTGLQTLTEIAWKLIEVDETQLAMQLINLLSEEQIYKSKIQELLEIKKDTVKCQPIKILLRVGSILRKKGLPKTLKAKAALLLTEALIQANKHNLSWKVCEREIRNISPETDLENWLAFQCRLCSLDLYFNQYDSAAARLMGLEKIVEAQCSRHFEPIVQQLKGEYFQNIGDIFQAQSAFQLSLEKYEQLHYFVRAKNLKNKMSQK